MTCYLKLINGLNMIQFLRRWEPFMSEKTLQEIAKTALEKIEKEKGHNYELIRKRAKQDDYWEKLLLETLAEWKKKKKTKKMIMKSEYTGEYVEEENQTEENSLDSESN